MSEDSVDQDKGQNEESFEALLEQSMTGSTKLEPGQMVSAEILQIGREWVFLDVGQKGEGVLDVKELLDEEGALTVEVGDTISAYFMSRSGGELKFTTRIGGGSSGTAQLEEAWRSEIPVSGRIDKEIKGGFDVRLPGNVRSFCPFSQVSLRRVENTEELIGQSFDFKITQFAENGRNIVVSRRVLLEEEERQKREELKGTLKEGMRVTGTVTSLRDFGAFVDIGGIEGLLPISEVAYGRVEDISEVLSAGQTLELVVKNIDWEANRFSFSRRDTLTDPWSEVPGKYPAGSQVSGTVSRLAPFGAFVTLEEGIDGLIHISKLGEGRRIAHPREVLQVGQALSVTVEKIDLDQRRISLVPAGTEAEVKETSWVEKPSAGGSMGTFADLLKAAEDKKKKR